MVWISINTAHLHFLKLEVSKRCSDANTNGVACTLMIGVKIFWPSVSGPLWRTSDNWLPVSDQKWLSDLTIELSKWIFPNFSFLFFQKPTLERLPDGPSYLQCCVAGIPNAANISALMLPPLPIPLLLLLSVDSAVANVISAVGADWVPAVDSAVSGIPATAVFTVVDIPGVPAVALGSLLLLSSLLLTPVCYWCFQCIWVSDVDVPAFSWRLCSGWRPFSLWCFHPDIRVASCAAVPCCFRISCPYW